MPSAYFKKCLFALGFVSFLSVAPTNSAVAFEIEIDPGDYTGSYKVDGGAPISGPTTEELSAGVHTITIAPSNNFGFSVSDSGQVSDQPPAEGGEKSLTFNTITVSVDPGDYMGGYSITGVDGAKAPGERDFVLLRGVPAYILQLAPGRAFRFDVADNGQVSPQKPETADGGEAQLTFKTVPIRVNPTTYTGTYFFNQNRDDSRSGKSVVVLVPDMSHLLGLRPGVETPFTIDAAGVPESPDEIDNETFKLKKIGRVDVSIDIRPGKPNNRIDPAKKARVPVAILTTESYDATSTDPVTVRFGPNKAFPLRSRIEDTNGDGKDDLVLRFQILDTGIGCEHDGKQIKATGRSRQGFRIRGSDKIKAVGC